MSLVSELLVGAWHELLASLVPVANFVLLVFVIVRLQWVRHELELRRQRFERIEEELRYLHDHTQSPRGVNGVH